MTTLDARAALASRLRTIAPLLLTGIPDAEPAGSSADEAAVLLDRIVAALAPRPTNDRVWLLLTALAAAYPTRTEVDEARRRIELDDLLEATLYLLDTSLARAQQSGEPGAELELVVGGVVVDVNHTARFNLHTGIQRVTRNLLPQWRSRDVVAAAWTGREGALRPLTARESERVYEWAERGDAGEGPLGDRFAPVAPVTRILVPWRSVVALIEVPPVQAGDRVAALGAASGNAVVVVGYDAIPVVSADAVPPVESSKFVRYLTAIKFAARVAGISASATAEFAGFRQMLATQGLPGPEVVEVRLPTPATPDRPREPRPGDQPLVLVVGSHEPRKNHLAVLQAAETLWRDGVRFDLRFIGGSGWGEEFPRRAADLKAAGRPLEIRKAVDDHELDQSFADAAFTVFPSLHEGYGLPVAESLSHGTPVITSDFGSTAEIAVGGGALTVDPRDDAELTAAMRELLAGPQRLVELRREITARTDRTWAGYAEQLWADLVVPARPAPAPAPAGAVEGDHHGVG